MNTSANKTPDTASSSVSRPLNNRLVLWHRRVGIVSALVVLALSLTGIILNHVDSLYEPNEFVSAGWILDWYDIPLPAVRGYRLARQGEREEGEASSDIIYSGGAIIVGGKRVLFDQEPVIGVTAYQDLTHIFTATELHLYTSDWQRVESVALDGAGNGVFLEAVGTAETGLVGLLGGEGEVRYYSLDDLGFVADAATALTQTLNAYQADLEQDARRARQFLLLKSKVLSDLHSGRFFGKAGPFVVDAFALCFLFLAGTGVWTWLRKGKRKSI